MCAYIDAHSLTQASVDLYFYKNEIILFPSSTIHHEHLSMLTHVDLHSFKRMQIILQNECAIINLTTLLLIKFKIFFFTIIKNSEIDSLCIYLAMGLVIS